MVARSIKGMCKGTTGLFVAGRVGSGAKCRCVAQQVGLDEKKSRSCGIAGMEDLVGDA